MKSRLIPVSCRGGVKLRFLLSVLRLSRATFCFALIPPIWAQQFYSRPSSPIFPTTMAECDKLQEAYGVFNRRFLLTMKRAFSRVLHLTLVQEVSRNPLASARCLLYDPLYAGHGRQVRGFDARADSLFGRVHRSCAVSIGPRQIRARCIEEALWFLDDRSSL